MGMLAGGYSRNNHLRDVSKGGIMIRFLDSSWRIVAVSLVLIIWFSIIGLTKLYDSGREYLEE